MFLTIVLLISGIFNTLVLGDLQTLELDANSLGVSCLPIVSEPEATVLGQIKIFLKELELNDGHVATDLKIPVLLFRYEDILNFTTLPSSEEYEEKYAYTYSSSDLKWDNYFLKNTVDFEESKFILDLYEGYNEIDDKRIYNGYLDMKGGHTEATLQAFESGLYCVYIAPPIDRDIKSLTIYVLPDYSKIYSSSLSYAEYCQMKYIIGVGLLLAAYMVNNILKFSKDKQLDIKNMPIISKTVIFYVLIPLLSFMSLECFVVFVELHCNLSGPKIRFFKYFRLAIGWIQPNWKILLRFYVLLFTMGYGVIYYHRGASRTFSKMPKRTKNIALSLFITDISLNNVDRVYDMFEKHLMSYHFLALHKNKIDFVCKVCFFGSFLFSFILKFVSFIYYFRTGKIIKKLPTASSAIEGIDPNTRIRKAFKQSSLVIFISPVISGLTWFMSFAWLGFKALSPLHNEGVRGSETGVKMLSRESLLELVELANHNMLFVQATMTSASNKWPESVKIYVTVVLLYVIWIRNNNALIVEDEKGDLKE